MIESQISPIERVSGFSVSERGRELLNEKKLAIPP